MNLFMACVVKHKILPIWRWKLCEFQHGKSISVSGINNIRLKGLLIGWVFETQGRKKGD